MSFLWTLVIALACVFGQLRSVASQAPYTDQQLDEFCDRQLCGTGSTCEIIESPYLLFPVPFCKPREDQPPDSFCGTVPPQVIGGDPLKCRTRDEFFQIASNECLRATYPAAFEVSESCLDYSSSGEVLYKFAQFFCCPSPTGEPTASGSGSAQSGSGSDTITEAPTDACLASEFSCNTLSECIPADYRCDGLTDCSDGSDEADCFCTKNKFQCDDGIRIDESAKCDLVNDCVNGTDEADCPRCTASNRFTCATGGRCTRKAFRCDGELDCDDSSDERGCEGVPCKSSDRWRCPCVGLCILARDRCDGRDDCGNNADELPENCPSNDFAAKDGDGKSEDKDTSINFVGTLVIGVGGGLGAVSVAILAVYVIRGRRLRKYESLPSLHMKKMEDAEPESLSFHNGTWSGYGDEEEWCGDNDKALLIPNEKTGKNPVFGYDNPTACDDFVNDDVRDIDDG